MKKLSIHGLSLLLAVFVLASCGGKKERSASTGWKYNDQRWIREDSLRRPRPFFSTRCPSKAATMGLTDQDVTYEWKAIRN